MKSPLTSILNCFRPATQAEEPTSHAAAPSGQPQTSQPPASGMLAGLAPRTPRRPLSDGECQLGGYLMGRELVAGPVEGADFDNIRRANQTVDDTRATLRYGRGNVRDDIDYSGGQSTVRTAAGYYLGKTLPSRLPEDVRRVAGAMTAQAGNCTEHADVAAFLHVPRLQEGEQVYSVSSTTVDHSWAEWRGQGSDGESRITMDAWGKGPAIFAEDGAFSSNEHEIKRNHNYDRTTGVQAHAQMQALQQKRHGRMQSELRRQMKKLGPDFRYGDDRTYEPMAVVSPEFAASVSSAMFRPLNTAPLSPPPEFEGHQPAEPVFTDELWMAPLRQQIHATEMARRLDSEETVQEITRAATRIADVAADLHRYPLEPYPQQFGPDDSESFQY